MNVGTSAGLMPANVFVKDRAIVIAGFAKDVDAVNQYAAPIQPATSHGTFRERLLPRMTKSKPKVATPSESSCAEPLRTCVETCTTGSSNIACASRVPATQ